MSIKKNILNKITTYFDVSSGCFVGRFAAFRKEVRLPRSVLWISMLALVRESRAPKICRVCWYVSKSVVLPSRPRICSDDCSFESTPKWKNIPSMSAITELWCWRKLFKTARRFSSHRDRPEEVFEGGFLIIECFIENPPNSFQIIGIIYPNGFCIKI